MSAAVQSVIALAVVAAAAAWLLWSWFGRRKAPGCGGGDCPAVSPEVRRLRSRLKAP